MPHSVRMPPLGQTSDELTIVRWLRAEGERVERGEPLLEVETDKVTMEVEATAAGTLLAIVQVVGATVPAGSVIAYVGEPGEALPGPEEPAAPRAAPTPRPAAAPAQPSPQAAGKAPATPAARRLAREHGVELERVRGTGPGGVIERKDVLAFLEGR